MIIAHELGTDRFLGTFKDLPNALRAFNVLREQGKLHKKTPRIVIRQYHRGKYDKTYTLWFRNGWRKEPSHTVSICILPAKGDSSQKKYFSVKNPSIFSGLYFRFIGIKQLIIASL